MGCISSKIVTRSSSFKEEFRQSFKRRVNGFPVLEDLFISNKGEDQFLSLVSTADTVTKKLQTRVQPQEFQTNSEPCLEASKPERINAWELMEGLEEEKDEGDRLITRSTRLDVRCRSFHTVEEFDALVQSHDRGRHTRSRSVDTLQEFDDKFVENNLWSQAEGKEHEIPVVTKIFPVKDNQEVNDTHEHKEEEMSSADLGVAVSSEGHPCQAQEDGSTDGTAENGKEKGFGRKAKAKELTSLSIPTSTSTPAVGSLGEWLDLGSQTYPTSDYMTPKFGNFSLPVPLKRNNSKERVIFDPELVAAFEESLKEMTAVEEFVLKQIAEGLGGEEEGIVKHAQKEDGAAYFEDSPQIVVRI
ncbi:uncharacterized protein [Aristolochia californica]|uniref:uncharacterized protein n=1 Tax=Aristolochia californica TaxID=171875 RepID=UPI0035DAF23F